MEYLLGLPVRKIIFCKKLHAGNGIACGINLHNFTQVKCAVHL